MNQRTARVIPEKRFAPACRVAFTGAIGSERMLINVAPSIDLELRMENGYLCLEQNGQEVRLNYTQAMKLAGHLSAVRYKEDAWEAAKE